ncbi:hypothetical protein HA402_007285 [Bradysia odoriphaga]|nr:hypothetical protein HA402_007285 [Bradysia odoriphaga]
MLAGEMGFKMTDIPLDHPDRDLFRFDRPFFDQKYDLILCDGQVLRTHKREEYREKTEAVRLSVSQLVFALQHMKNGGSFVMLLHNADSSHVFNLIYKFRQISASIHIFKPTKYHTIRSSFYLVAKGVNPHCADALQAVNEWKEIWSSCTIHRCGEVPPISDENIREILVDFGVEFIEMCEPMWKIQVDSLSRKLKSGFDNFFRY